jgi:hypothetical protein
LLRSSREISFIDCSMTPLRLYTGRRDSTQHRSTAVWNKVPQWM